MRAYLMVVAHAALFPILLLVILLRSIVGTVFGSGFFGNAAPQPGSSRPSRHGGLPVVAFFHPHAFAGGGGERVLWQAIHSLLSDDKRRVGVVVFVSSPVPQLHRSSLVAHIQNQFGIDIPEEAARQRLRLQLVPFVSLISPASYPYATILMQLLGSAVVAIHAFLLQSHVQTFVDTTGFAPTCLVAKLLFRVRRTVAYVHYPTVSDVHLGPPGHGSLPSSSASPSSLRMAYLRAVYFFYGKCGNYVDVAMSNSSWTLGRISKTWPATRHTLVFPPCPVSDLLAQPLPSCCRPSEPLDILTLGQFRPEKNHRAQLEAMALLRLKLADDPSLFGRLRLVIVGGLRNSEDRMFCDSLKEVGRHLLGEEVFARQVLFRTNVSYTEIRAWLGASPIGMHTMKDEHFGISLVEMMAAGTVPVAHRSGGPLLDIVGPDGTTGLLAETSEEFAEQLARLVRLASAQSCHHGEGSNSPFVAMQQACRKQAAQFSEEEFESRFLASLF